MARMATGYRRGPRGSPCRTPDRERRGGSLSSTEDPGRTRSEGELYAHFAALYSAGAYLFTPLAISSRLMVLKAFEKSRLVNHLRSSPRVPSTARSTALTTGSTPPFVATPNWFGPESVAGASSSGSPGCESVDQLAHGDLPIPARVLDKRRDSAHAEVVRSRCCPGGDHGGYGGEESEDNWVDCCGA